jgi:hypothetical protein
MARKLGWFSFAALLAAMGAARAADEFPYTAYVAVDRAEVVAGPGQRFYATERLKRGTAIEIYREEASGWLAIRPTEASFSWVPARHVELAAEDASLGRVTEPTPAWIGTGVEHVSEHRQQVTLKEGELVKILGEKSVKAEGESEQWLKIAPPAGEFRWIHLRDVSRQMPPPQAEPESVVVEPSQLQQPPEPRRLEQAGQAIALQDLERPDARRLPLVERAQFQAAGGSPVKAISPDGFVPRKRASEHLTPQPAPTAPLPRAPQPLRSQPVSNALPQSVTSQPLVSTMPRSAVSDEDLAAQLERIELDLSLMVAQDKSLWDLNSIKTRLANLVERGGDPASRGRARLVLEKVDQFERAFAVQDYGPIRSAKTATSSAPPASGSLADPRYDTQGWLKPVISRQGDKPIAPYAVVDQDGQPLCFITPQPGLNLRRYENKPVGVYGRRGYLAELKKPHVTAERIIELDRQLR